MAYLISDAEAHRSVKAERVLYDWSVKIAGQDAPELVRGARLAGPPLTVAGEGSAVSLVDAAGEIVFHVQRQRVVFIRREGRSSDDGE